MTSQLMLSETEARAIAFALEAMRPEWNRQGIAKALFDAKHKANKWVVLLAAVHAASDESNRTPAVIAMDGKHWPELRTPPQPARIATLPELSPDERERARDGYLRASMALQEARER